MSQVALEGQETFLSTRDMQKEHTGESELMKRVRKDLIELSEKGTTEGRHELEGLSRRLQDLAE